jgi:hypothetical protein
MAVDRFWNKVDKSDDCWLWTASKLKQGYGRFNFNGKLILAHRMSWILTNGEIPNEMCALHSCDNPSCVNPSHLRLGTKKDNSQDKIQRGRDHNQKRTHCPHGHELVAWKNRRYCQVCNKLRQRVRRAKVGA